MSERYRQEQIKRNSRYGAFGKSYFMCTECGTKYTDMVHLCDETEPQPIIINFNIRIHLEDLEEWEL